MLVKTTYLNRLVAALITSTAGTPPTPPLAAAKVALIGAPATLSPQSAFADLTEASYSGYARSATVVWSTPINEGDGSVSWLSQALLFAVTGTTPTPGSVYGYALIDAATPPNLLAAEIFQGGPIPLVITGDGFMMLAKMNYGIADGNEIATVVR